MLRERYLNLGGRSVLPLRLRQQTHTDNGEVLEGGVVRPRSLVPSHIHVLFGAHVQAEHPQRLQPEGVINEWQVRLLIQLVLTVYRNRLQPNVQEQLVAGKWQVRQQMQPRRAKTGGL